MGFWQRVGEFFGFRSASSSSSSAEARLARGTPLWRRDQAAMLQAFSDFPHLHTVVGARGESAARFNPLVYEVVKKNTRADELGLYCLRGADFTGAVGDLIKEGVLKEQLNSDLLRLLRRPSQRMSGPDFWELSSHHEDLIGETLWIKGARVGRRPTRLHLYVPTWLQHAPDPTDKDQTFIFQLPSGRVTAPAADVIWRKRHNPVDPYNLRGVGTAYVLRDELMLDELLAVMARGRAANKNYPDIILALLGQAGRPGPGPGQAEVDVVTKMLEQKHGGPERVGQAHVMAGDFKAQALGHTFVESQYMETRRFGRDTNMQTFRMPPEIAGVLDNANRSTIAVARDQFESTATAPKFDRWRATIQDELVPDFGDNLVVGFRSPVPADREYEAGFFKALPAMATVNEIRARAGLPPRADGNEYYKAPGAVPVAGSPSSPDGDDSPDKKKPKAKENQ